MNAIEKSVKARRVSNYVIEHLLIDGPIGMSHLPELVHNVTSHNTNAPCEVKNIANVALDYLVKDPRVLVTTKNDGYVWLVLTGTQPL